MPKGARGKGAWEEGGGAEQSVDVTAERDAANTANRKHKSIYLVSLLVSIVVAHLRPEPTPQKELHPPIIMMIV